MTILQIARSSSTALIGVPGRNAGFSFTWNVSTERTDPGPGRLAADAEVAQPTLTRLRLSHFDADGTNIFEEIDWWLSAVESAKRARLVLFASADPTNRVHLEMGSGSAHRERDAWSEVVVAVTPSSANGVFADGTAVTLQPHVIPDRGEKGYTGSIGPQGSYDEAQAPFRYNNAPNGAFNIWQRGTPFTLVNANGWTADRWYMNGGGSGSTNIISRLADSLDSQNPYFLHWSRTVAGTAPALLEHWIEYVRTLQGQQVTLAFEAQSDQPTTVDTQIRQFFGVGGSVSQVTAAKTHSLVSAWQTYLHTVTLPSVSGMTITPGDALGLSFTRAHDAANPLASLYLRNVRLVGGAYPHYLPRTVAEDFDICARYCYVPEYGLSRGMALGPTLVHVAMRFPQIMRAPPAVTLEPTAFRCYEPNATPRAVSAATLQLNGMGGAVLALTTTGMTAGAASLVELNAPFPLFEAEF